MSKLTEQQVADILDRHFNKKQSRDEILAAHQELDPSTDSTLLYRITLPKGAKDARYKKERERFFNGYKPLPIPEMLEQKIPEQQKITEHEGKKYLRTVIDPITHCAIQADVYAVLDAFNVTCPGRQQAIKKLLCTGQRGKGDELEDLMGALAALNRAIELCKTRNTENEKRGREKKERSRRTR
jgi:hypothetical protein